MYTPTINTPVHDLLLAEWLLETGICHMKNLHCESTKVSTRASQRKTLSSYFAKYTSYTIGRQNLKKYDYPQIITYP